MKTSLLVLVASFGLLSCEQQPNKQGAVPSSQPVAPSATREAEVPRSGRYVFYPDNREVSGGRLLDTATGEMWIIAYDTSGGKLGRQMLISIGKPVPGASANDPLGIR